MNVYVIGGLFILFSAGAGLAYSKVKPASSAQGESIRYVKSEIYTQCDRDYLQSAPHLGFKAQKSDCECFDEKLQLLTSAQRAMAYKSLEDHLTLKFMGKAGAQVSGTNVNFNDKSLGNVSADLNVETSGNAIMKQCSMF